MGDTVAGDDLGIGLAPGAHHYRAFVGPPQDYDLIGAMTFNLLTTAGLRQHHRLVDVGCGSLRAGRLFIPYLNVGNYIGIEPHRWLLDEAIKREVGRDLIRIKAPRFIFKAVLEETDWFEADYALAQSIFSHASRAQVARWLHDLYARLTQAGALFATFVSGSKDYQGDEWIYPGCVTYRSETMAEAAHQAGFQFTSLSWRHPRQTWALLSKPGFKIWWSAEKPLTWNARPDAGS
jgi:cyclopropane fatty-acyl-phospholipid synthase-like methyltransferase